MVFQPTSSIQKLQRVQNSAARIVQTVCQIDQTHQVTTARSSSGSHSLQVSCSDVQSQHHFDANVVPEPSRHNTPQCADTTLDNEYTAVRARRAVRPYVLFVFIARQHTAADARY